MCRVRIALLEKAACETGPAEYMHLCAAAAAAIEHIALRQVFVGVIRSENILRGGVGVGGGFVLDGGASSLTLFFWSGG